MSLLTQCRTLLRRRGATITGNGPCALRGHLEDGTSLLVVLRPHGKPFLPEEVQAVENVRRGGGVGVLVHTAEQLQEWLEEVEA